METIRSRRAATLVALFLIVTGCVATRAPSGRGNVFMYSPLSATTLEVEYHAGELPAYQRALAALCRCVELARDRGYPYLQIYDRERLGPGAARWKMRLFHAPPADAVLLDAAAPTWEGSPPGDAVLDAVSIAAACS